MFTCCPEGKVKAPPMPLPPVLAFTFCKGLYKHCGFIRYNLVMSHLLVMVGMVLKMVGRWVFNLKYVVFMPEIFFNI